MAVPYSKKSRSKTRMQRAANMKYSAVNVQACQHCGEPVLSHRVCPSCGKYAERQVLAKQEL